ncbi:MAG: tetratricopeptide repeat protein [Gemmatimonadota bacterium]
MQIAPFVIAFAFIGSNVSAQQPSLVHAKQLLDKRELDAAKAEYTALARMLPNDVTPSLQLGRIAMSQNETEEAIKQFEQCAKIDDTNADCHAWLGNALGNAAMRANKFKLPFLAKRTKKEFDRAVELDPGNIEGRMGELQYYLNAPGFLGGSVEKAREQAAEIEKHNKMRAALAYAVIAEKDKKTTEAEAAYLRAVSVAPDSVNGYNGLVNLYVREKRWSDAFAILDRVTARIPTELNIPLAVARVAYLSGEQLPRGEAAAKGWLANPPKDASIGSKTSAHIRLGNIYEKTGRKELARAEYERALSVNPKSEDAKKALENVR